MMKNILATLIINIWTGGFGDLNLVVLSDAFWF